MNNRLDQVRRVVESNLVAGDRPLNGLIRLDESDSSSYFALPYFAAVESVAHKYGKTKRYDKDFRMGYGPLLELVTKLIRSLQRLGIAAELMKGFLDKIYSAGDNPSVIEVEVGVEGDLANAVVDISIAADSCLVYARIIADRISLTLPALFGEPPYRGIKRSSFREMMKGCLKDTATPLGELFHGASLEWFEVLSGRGTGDPGSHKGIRENLVHYGAFNTVSWYDESVGEGGEPTWKLQIHQKGEKELLGDLLANLAVVCGGLFGFMDRACRLALQQGEGIDFRECKYVWEDVIPVAGPIDFLGTMLPRLTPDHETPRSPIN